MEHKSRFNLGWRVSIALAVASVGFMLWTIIRLLPDEQQPASSPDVTESPSPGAVRSAAPDTQREPRARLWIPTLHPEKLDEGTRITIDGKLDEPAWQTASKAVFVDVRTGRPNREFPVNGSVRLLWDDVGFYVGFEISDPDVTGGFDRGAKDPHLWTRDTVEIMVDPDGDGDNVDYYEIQIGPQNLVFDSAFDRYNEPRTEPDGPFGHEEWSSNVTSAVVVNGTLDRPDDRDEGYVVEALLPWKAFHKAKRIPPAIGDTWRLNFYAMENNGGVAWSPILNLGNFHRASRFGRVVWSQKGAGGPRDRLLFQEKPLRRAREPLVVPSLRPPSQRLGAASKERAAD